VRKLSASIVIAFFATTAVAVDANQSQRASVSALVVKFFDNMGAKNIVGVRETTWSDACFDVGEEPCQKLQDTPFGRTEDRWKVNDMKVSVRGRKAAISLHSTHFLYNMEGTTRARSVCLRALEAERRNGVWKLSRMNHVNCRHYDKNGIFQP
jgi:hypothetical protein